MRQNRAIDAEPVAGYRLIAPMGRGVHGETWKCLAADGSSKVIKFVGGATLSGTPIHIPDECPTLQHLKGIDHPFLLRLFGVEVEHDELAIIMEPADKSLADILDAKRRAGEPGIPREELVEYLCEASETLDWLNDKRGLAHLNVKPSNILSVFNHAKVADAGLVSDLSGVFKESAAPTGEPLVGISPPYAAPEIFTGRFTRSSDQYSLAITYQELLTGTLPFDGKTAWQLAMQHAMSPPNLEALPARDRPIVAKALSKDPESRYPSCLMFMMALVTGQAEPRQIPEEKLTAARIIRCLYGGGLFQGDIVVSPSGAADMAETPAMSWEEFTRLTEVDPQSQAQAIAAATTPEWLKALAPAEAAADEGLPPGYTFIKELSRSPLGDLWKVQAPDGESRMVKILLFHSHDRTAESRAVANLKNLSHPALVKLDFVKLEQARLLIGMEMIDDTVRKQFEMFRAEGAPGIPRKELLDYLWEAAKALDELYEKMAIAHLAINPTNLMLTGRGLLLADFGLWHLLGNSLVPAAQCNYRYAAPELAGHRPSRASDQFSLAIIYQEMLTGVRPFRDRTPRPGSGPAVRGRRSDAPALSRPDLEPLPAPDREVIARALDLLPKRRFESCTELIRALEACTVETRNAKRTEVLGGVKLPVDPSAPHPRAAIHELFEATVGQRRIQEIKAIRSLVRPGEALVHRCGAFFAGAMTKSKLKGFGRDLNLKVVRAEENIVVYHKVLGGSLLSFSRKPTLEIQVRIVKPRVEGTRLMEVEMTFRPLHCPPDKAAWILNEAAPALVERLRMYLVANPEYRNQERLPYELPLVIAPALADGSPGEPIQAVGKDITEDGMGFYARHSFAVGNYLVVHLNVASHPTPVLVPGQVLRSQDCGHGWYEIGVRLITDF